jgi:hypothetical protein
MYTVREAIGNVGRRKVLVVEEEGRRIASASLNFVHWMHGRVPSHQLSPEQVALVAWFDILTVADT